MSAQPRIVVMGVSGAGKTAVGECLAEHLGLPFCDADNLHPQANVDKMAAGTPLTDSDRWPWLRRVGEHLAASDGLVVACSALKRSYRDAIRAVAPGTVFVFLEVERRELERRVADRSEHFMPASLLDSQLETLEPLESDEAGVTVESDGGVEESTLEALAALG